MPTLSRDDLNLISAAFKSVHTNVEEIKSLAPEVRAACDCILEIIQPALRVLEVAAQRVDDGFAG